MKTSNTVVATFALAAGALCAQAHAQQFTATLAGVDEVPAAILSKGSGTLQMNLDPAGSLTYTLTYSGLSAPVSQAHIHFGKVHVAGGIMAFLCTNMGNGPADTPACPENGGTVTGTITPAQIVAINAQNVQANDFAAIVTALTTSTAYANVHTSTFPAGEIRGDISGPAPQPATPQQPAAPGM